MYELERRGRDERDMGLRDEKGRMKESEEGRERDTR